MASIPVFINPESSTIAAAIHTPATSSGKLAILCPGTVDSKDYAHLVRLADALCERGYTAVRFDPTGTWESAGDIATYSVTQYLRDVRTVIDHMLATGTYEHILIAGHSLGGVITMLYAARDPRISAVVNIMGSATFPRRYNAEVIDAWKNSGSRCTQRDLPGSTAQRTFIIPYTFVIDRLQYHVLEDIGAVHAPLLLIAGEQDDVVPTDELAKIYKHANQPKQLITIPGIGHDYRHHIDEVALVNERIMGGLAQLLHE